MKSELLPCYFLQLSSASSDKRRPIFSPSCTIRLLFNASRGPLSLQLLATRSVVAARGFGEERDVGKRAAIRMCFCSIYTDIYCDRNNVFVLTSPIMLFSWCSFEVNFVASDVSLRTGRIHSPCNPDLNGALHRSAELLATRWTDRWLPFDRRRPVPRQAPASLRCSICRKAAGASEEGRWKDKKEH